MLPVKVMAAQEKPDLSRIYVQLAILRGLLAGNGSAKMLPGGAASAESITKIYVIQEWCERVYPELARSVVAGILLSCLIDVSGRPLSFDVVSIT
jgi:hypothetical protein